MTHCIKCGHAVHDDREGQTCLLCQRNGHLRSAIEQLGYAHVALDATMQELSASIEVLTPDRQLERLVQETRAEIKILQKRLEALRYDLVALLPPESES